MPTATRTRDALGELEHLEAEWQRATATASNLASDHGRKLRLAGELTDKRRQLVHRSPELDNHTGAAADPKNEAGQIDREIAKLGDLNDLAAQVSQARRLEEAAKLATYDYIATNFGAVVEGFRPTAEAASLAVGAKAEELRVLLESYIRAAQRSIGLTAPVQGVDGRCVPGLNEAAALMRAVTDVRLPVPVPELT
jgi:hypothetical protein